MYSGWRLFNSIIIGQHIVCCTEIWRWTFGNAAITLRVVLSNTKYEITTIYNINLYINMQTLFFHNNYVKNIFIETYYNIFNIYAIYKFLLPWIHWMAIVVQNQYSLIITFTFYITKFWFSPQWGSRNFPRIPSLKFFTIFSTVNSYFFYKKIKF